ncbi:hypothetical protein CSKR_110797 [Clonorchis sinensis]|uniref:Uncharacterized protein n=1 Tax=Clonorchis sinensis TaxID=79923 RepID=A0A419QBF4_CLOSI|nr:hypothetical protein CSKR_110797 [Clonorchis sinensis]
MSNGFHDADLSFCSLVWLKWLDCKSTDRKVRGSNPTSVSRLSLSRLGQLGSFLSISVIVERQEGLKMKELLERLKPKDNSRIILRRFGTNVCVCMNQSGQVITERLIDDTVSDNCEWRMRSSRYGLGFQRVFEDDDIPVGESDTRMPANYLIATLSVDPTASIASGWSYRLWQPEATWEVHVEKYIKLQRDMVNNVTEVRNNTRDSMTNLYSFPLLSDPKPDKVTDERTSMRVGEREVYSLEILPQDIDSLYRESQQMYCDKIELKLLDTVRREITASILILNKLHVSLSKLQARLKTNPSPFKSKPMARLLDEWLLLTYYRWQHKVQRQVIAQPKVAYQCSLSFQNPYLKVSNKGDLAKATILEKQEFASVYRGMLFNLYHLASWTVAQRRNWIARPRLTTLFSYLNLSIPSVAQLRQASFILNRYVSQGKMYYLSDDSTKRKLAQMLRSKTQSQRIFERSVLLKYEELRFWPLIQQRTGKKYESSLIKTDDLRAEILQLPNESYCAKGFLQEWQGQRERESPSSCVYTHPSRPQLSWHTNHPRNNAIHLYRTHSET